MPNAGVGQPGMLLVGVSGGGGEGCLLASLSMLCPPNWFIGGGGVPPALPISQHCILAAKVNLSTHLNKDRRGRLGVVGGVLVWGVPPPRWAAAGPPGWGCSTMPSLWG